MECVSWSATLKCSMFWINMIGRNQTWKMFIICARTYSGFGQQSRCLRGSRLRFPTETKIPSHFVHCVWWSVQIYWRLKANKTQIVLFRNAGTKDATDHIRPDGTLCRRGQRGPNSGWGICSRPQRGHTSTPGSLLVPGWVLWLVLGYRGMPRNIRFSLN